MLLGVEDVVRNPLAFEHCAEEFRFFNRNGPYQDRATLLMQLSDLFDHSLKFLPLCPVYHISVLCPDQGAIGRNHHHFQIIDRVKFGCLSISSASHAPEFAVHTEIILEGNRG